MSRDLVLLALSLMTWGVGEGMFFYFQPVYLKELGANPVTIGIVLGAVGLVMTLVHIPAGYLSDRIGRRPLLIISWLTGMLSAWIMALAQTLPVFIAGMLLYSVTAFVISPLNSYVTTARGNLSVGRALTLMSASYNSGAILGPFFGGLIGGKYGLHTIYQVSASIFIVSVLIILNIRPQAIYQHLEKETHQRFKISPHYAVYLLIVFITMFATYLPQPLTPNYLQDFHGLSIEQLGRLGSIASIGIVTLSLTLGSAPAHWGFLLAQVCVGLYTLLIWKGTGMPWYVIGYFLMGGYRAARVLAAAQTRRLVSQAYMGLAFGITETVATSTVVLAPPIAGYLYNFNPSLIYRISLILVSLSIISSLLFNPSRSMPQLETGDLG